MKRTFKNLLFIFVMILFLPCLVIFSGCKQEETGFYVVYKGIRVNGGSLNLSFNATEEIDVLSEMQAYVKIKKSDDKKIELSSLEISSNISETVEPGDEYEIEIKYKKFNAIKISIKINKLENSVSVGKNSKVYDGEPFKNQDLEASALNQEGISFEWYRDETKLSSNPTDAGKYRVKISIPESKKYKKVEKFFDVEILKAEPDVDWSVISIGNTYLSTDTLSKISLPENFSWKNPQTVLGKGTSKHTIVYTPANSNYNSAEKEFDVSALLAFNLPTQKTITFSRETITLGAENLVGFDADLMELKAGANELSQFNAGEYSAKIGFKDGVDAVWFDGTKEDKTFSWTISKRRIVVPYYSSDFVLMPLNGSVILEWNNVDHKYCYIMTSRTVVDGNKITFDEPVNTSVGYKLNDPDNCVWEDGTNEVKTQHFSIDRDAFEQIKYTPYGGEERIISTSDLMELENVCVGSVFEFVLKDPTMFLKVDGENVKDGRVVATADLNKVDVRVFVNDKDTIAIFGKDIPIYFYFTSIVVNDEEDYVDLIDNDFNVELKENQTSFTIELPKVLEGRNLTLLRVDHNDKYNYLSIKNLHIVIDNADKYQYIEIIDDATGVTIVNVYVLGFTRIDHFVVETINEYNKGESEFSYTFGEASSFSSFITGIDVAFKSGYENLTFDLVDANGNVFTSFEDLNGKEYFLVRIKNGNEVLETAKIYYLFINNFPLGCDANDYNTKQLDFNTFYTFIQSQDKLESSIQSQNSKVNFILNDGNEVTFPGFGLYKVPISVSYQITSDFTVTYSTSLIVNYSNSYSSVVTPDSQIRIGSIYSEDPISVSAYSNNKKYVVDVAEMRAILEGNTTVDTSGLNLETGYTFKSINAFVTNDILFGFKVILNNGTEDLEHIIYVPVEGKYDGNTGIEKVVIESYVYEDENATMNNETIKAGNINALKFVSIYPGNTQSLCKITDEAGNIVFAGFILYSDCFEVNFNTAGTYKVTIIAPNGERKEYTLIVSGKDIGKPITKVVAGTNENQVTLECVKDDEESYGDFLIGFTDSPYFVGYFGEAMLSEIKTINGEEFLDVSIDSILIDRMSIDKDKTTLVKNGVNTLRVLIDENDEKFVEIYLSMPVGGRNYVIRCMVYLADLPTDGE